MIDIAHVVEENLRGVGKIPKFFVTSDIHGFFDEFKKALDEAGFDENNENHWVIACGDYFDRGNQPISVMRYLKNLPHKVLIRGNHEQLLEELCKRGFPYNHDFSNGTYTTGCYLGLASDDGYNKALKKVKPFFKSMVNYFETKNYIFAHSWVPVRNFEFNPDWRNANQKEWEDAMWGNPYDMIAKGLLPDKTIVFGHWHCSTGWAKSEGYVEFGENAKFDPYCGNGFISIDACTAYSGKCNVIVLEDDFL